MDLNGILLLAILLLSGLVITALTKRRYLRVTGVAIVAIGVIIASLFLWQAYRWDHGFAQIHVGDDTEHVTKIMGRPTADTDATISIYGSKRSDIDRAPPGCTEQCWYYPFFTPECWWIALDAQGRVLKTYHYISP